MLSVVDRKWREHLYEMDYLQEGIGLRAMGQRDPLVEYQREGFDMFTAMMDAIKEESVGFLFNVEVQLEEPVEAPEEPLVATGPGEVAGEVVVEQLLSKAPSTADADVPAAPSAPALPDLPGPDPAPFAPTPFIEPASVAEPEQAVASAPVDAPAVEVERTSAPEVPVAELPTAPPAEPEQAVASAPVDTAAAEVERTQEAAEPVAETPPPSTAATEIETPAAPQPAVEETSAPAAAAPEAASPAAPQPAVGKLPEAFGRPDRPQGLSYSSGGQTTSGPAVPDPLTGEVKSGGPSRNAPCPCGSGRKYKRCHGDPTKQ